MEDYKFFINISAWGNNSGRFYIENKAIKRYIDLCIVGDSTIPERYGIIQATKLKAQKQMEELQKQMELLDFKEAFYQNLIKNNLKDTWNPMNNHTPEEAMA